jgi:hypothetical protein
MGKTGLAVEIVDNHILKPNIPDDLSPYIGTQDYINRGGIRVVRDSATDVLRLGRMFVDTKSPNGIFLCL